MTSTTSPSPPADSAVLIAELRARVKLLEAGLRPFAEAYRTMRETDQAIGARHCAAQDFARAAELVPEETT